MKKIGLLMLLLSPVSLFALDLSQELAIGYYDDLGITLGLRVEDPGFPVFAQGRIGTTYQMDPGNAEEARLIFINGNQGGSVEEYGQSYFFALDLGWKALSRKSMQLELVASGLVNRYNANFAYIGDNEDFTVKTTAFGFGVGGNMRILFSGRQSALVVKCGIEYFPKTKFEAHGTYYYTPDDEDSNPREDYTYDDADEAVNQPRFRPYVMLGIIYPIGGN